MRLGNYEVVRHLGAGGMSTVWLARGPVPATLTAAASAAGLVVLKQQMRPDDDDALREEARVGARLRHPGVVQTLGCFDDDAGRPVLVLEYVEGVALAQLRKRAPLPAPAVCRIGADIAEALGALHDARILHRDVTPANIIVSHDGSARLIDLGIARSSESAMERTATGTVKGTLRYVAPELFDGTPHDATTDLWALGVCLFEAALGRPAATGSESIVLGAVLRGQLFTLQPSEHIDPLVHEVVTRLCTKERAQRTTDARAIARRLATGDRGDGAMLASIAVYAAVDEPRDEARRASDAQQRRDAVPAPASSGADNGFARMAASTYCGAGGDDDDPFSEASQASTIITPSAHEDRLVPAPVTALADTVEAQPIRLPSMTPARTSPAGLDDLEVPPTTPGTPGGMRRGPALGDAWDIPQPITGEDDVGAPTTSTQPSGTLSPSSYETEPLPRSPHTTPTVDELPVQLATQIATQIATQPGTNTRNMDDPTAQAVDLREHAIGAPSIAAIVVVVVVVVAIALAVLVAISN
jgi:eukaryotic-like serine/threonine-protein kinase